ncbi:MAG: hypothetical protein Q8M54_10765 [Desulfobaccales bacterium]|nr:hypothetical protein [Desulfobaccales bacterium]
MSTWNLRLLPCSDFYENKPTGLGPRAYIAIKHPSDRIKWKEGKNEIEFDTISFDCSIFEELEREVNRLIKELETIKNQGKKFFEKETEKRRVYVEGKSKLD